jgi:probable rRNA maturation factor
MQIQIFNRQNILKIPKVKIKKIVAAVIAYENQSCDEVAIHFVSVKEICELHQTFFNDPSQTDCISLPLDDESEIHYRVLGEVFVCTKTACEYAASHQKDPYDELTLYIVHGLLHLIGYDDIKTKDRAIMRAAEQRHILNLKELKLCLSSE